jgi:hypothetical protein
MFSSLLAISVDDALTALLAFAVFLASSLALGDALRKAL